MAQVIGIDIGGTFTDLVVINTETGEITSVKVDSTPPRFAAGFFHALEKADIDLKNVSYLVHGTTVATNAVVERKGAKVGLITTKGFKDVIEIMRGNREFHYDLQWEKPKPLIPRFLRLGVSERLNSKGEVVIPLNKDEVKEAVSYFKKRGVEVIAICTLHSFMNPVHELKIEEIIKEEFPGVFTSVSAKILPEIREFERSCTVAMNAYVKPVVIKYIDSLRRRLKEKGLQRDLMIMKSNGSVMTPKMACEIPIATIGSGPAGGVVGGTLLGEEVITCDLGGTSFDVSLITKRKPKLTTEKDITWGMPLRIPQVDVLSVGKGGGSIAWIDAGGLLRIGPKSAGAYPGPACYGRGGKEPTLTDACLVLGILNEKYFLGGEMPISKDLAIKAIEKKLSKKLNMSVKDIAVGIYKIAVAGMVEAIKLVSVKRGFDPREFTMVAYGGGGPIFAGILAKELSISNIIFPRNPGVFSALGLLLGDVQFDYTRSYPTTIENVDLDKLNSILNELEDKGRENLKEESFEKHIEILRSADMRYMGQNFEVNTLIPEGKITQEKLVTLVERFHQEHEKWYGYRMKDERVEIVILRVSANSKQVIKPTFRKVSSTGNLREALKGKRLAYFGGIKDFVESPVYQRDMLKAGHIIEGQAIIEQTDTTIIIYPEQVAKIDEVGNIVVTINKKIGSKI